MFAVVDAAAVMLEIYMIWLEVAPKSGIGTPEIIWWFTIYLLNYNLVVVK